MEGLTARRLVDGWYVDEEEVTRIRFCAKIARGVQHLLHYGREVVLPMCAAVVDPESKNWKFRYVFSSPVIGSTYRIARTPRAGARWRYRPERRR
jgi:hypothetical protein